MSLLITGIMTWCVVHLFPSVAPAARQAVSARMGNAYRGLFALLILLSLALIVVGWRAALPAAVYVPPLYGSPIISVLMLLAFVLFIAARAPTNIRRFLRHPQLTSVIVWAVAHLLANGDSRSLALFGSLGAWAALEIVLINRRDGAWIKPGAFPLKADVIAVLIGTAAFAIILYLHESLFGARPY
jgi:uncharacterized membrane protein